MTNTKKYQTVLLPKKKLEQAKERICIPTGAPLTKVVEYALSLLIADDLAQDWDRKAFKMWLDREE